MSTHLNSPKFLSEVQSLVNGTVPSSDNSSIDTGLVAWNKLKTILDESTTGSAAFTNSVFSTYSLVYTTSSAYIGGVLGLNGDINFMPFSANRGQKISGLGTVSTYSLVYTTSSAYAGGVLAPNGDVNFIPYSAGVGQKLNSSGVVSTYSLVYTTSGAYLGGVLGTNGDVHFIPYNANRGQKISIAGVVSTYSLVYTTSGAYSGGVLAPNGDINFIPFNATVGQKISSAGVVSTYSLIYTGPVSSSKLTVARGSGGASTFSGAGTSASPFTRVARIRNDNADGLMASGNGITSGTYTFTVTASGTAYVTCTFYDDDLNNAVGFIRKNGTQQGAYIADPGSGGTVTARSIAVVSGDVIAFNSDYYTTSFSNVSVWVV